jgi:hypothetical protein
MANKWRLRLRGDIGGFGIGSDLSWNLSALIVFKGWKHVSIGGGYRVFNQDYSDGNGINKFAYDATLHGPMLGVEFTW